VKVGDKWYAARIQLNKEYSGSDVGWYLSELVGELSTRANASYKICIEQVEVFSQGHSNTGLYASLNTKLLFDNDVITNEITKSELNDSIEAEDFGSSAHLPGLKFVVEGARHVLVNNSAERKDDGQFLIARTLAATGLKASLIVLSVTLKYQPY